MMNLWSCNNLLKGPGNFIIGQCSLVKDFLVLPNLAIKHGLRHNVGKRG